jgi:hypothetical protein
MNIIPILLRLLEAEKITIKDADKNLKILESEKGIARDDFMHGYYQGRLDEANRLIEDVRGLF